MSACLFMFFEIEIKNKHFVNFVQTGRRLLNTCPPLGSCGTWLPIWTDEEAAEDVLSPATMIVYASKYHSGDPSSNCKHYVYQIEVMRCSLDNDYDLIYRYIEHYYVPCSAAFCGTN